jgi:hypothetical protein
MRNRFFISLERSPLRFLATPSQLTQQSPNMAGVIRDAQSLLDEFGNAIQRPQLCAISGRYRTSQQQLNQRLPLVGVQTWRTTRYRLGRQAYLTFLFKTPLPPPDRTPIRADRSGDRPRRLTSFQQLNGMFSAFLQLLWRSGRSHALNHTRVLHSLCEIQ